MARYLSRPRSAKPRANYVDADTPWQFVPHLEVDDVNHQDTGLVDDVGNSIYRLQDPIGFGKREGLIEA